MIAVRRRFLRRIVGAVVLVALVLAIGVSASIADITGEPLPPDEDCPIKAQIESRTYDDPLYEYYKNGGDL